MRDLSLLSLSSCLATVLRKELREHSVIWSQGDFPKHTQTYAHSLGMTFGSEHGHVVFVGRSVGEGVG